MTSKDVIAQIKAEIRHFKPIKQKTFTPLPQIVISLGTSTPTQVAISANQVINSQSSQVFFTRESYEKFSILNKDIQY